MPRQNTDIRDLYPGSEPNRIISWVSSKHFVINTMDNGPRSEQSERKAKAPKPTIKVDTLAPPQPTQREKDIINFCSPYSDLSFIRIKAKIPSKVDGTAPVDNSSKAQSSKTFLPCADRLEAELSRIIGLDWMKHRIDVGDGSGRLVLPKADAREGIRGRALSAAAEIEHDLLLRLHAVNVAVAGLEMPSAGSHGGWAWF
ncbi:COP9 signalosome complex subunit 1 [Teratosphaeria destructans]|uniref:COP9 signalosome complex subunit 1 n=1 Tax=Teratosphaeria destructans TaxID=418781 RepID=A0A9W7W647_9PEZI|nr:COP9 signalosome complex subunit 1 [Teratosphaeria destructans]